MSTFRLCIVLFSLLTVQISCTEWDEDFFEPEQHDVNFLEEDTEEETDEDEEFSFADLTKANSTKLNDMIGHLQKEIEGNLKTEGVSTTATHKAAAATAKAAAATVAHAGKITNKDGEIIIPVTISSAKAKATAHATAAAAKKAAAFAKKAEKAAEKKLKHVANMKQSVPLNVVEDHPNDEVWGAHTKPTDAQHGPVSTQHTATESITVSVSASMSITSVEEHPVPVKHEKVPDPIKLAQEMFPDYLIIPKKQETPPTDGEIKPPPSPEQAAKKALDYKQKALEAEMAEHALAMKLAEAEKKLKAASTPHPKKEAAPVKPAQGKPKEAQEKPKAVSQTPPAGAAHTKAAAAAAAHGKAAAAHTKAAAKAAVAAAAHGKATATAAAHGKKAPAVQHGKKATADGKTAAKTDTKATAAKTTAAVHPAVPVKVWTAANKDLTSKLNDEAKKENSGSIVAPSVAMLLALYALCFF